MKFILILEDNDERIAGFEAAVAKLGDGFELKIWQDAYSMIAECEVFFPTVALISLDHDLNPQPEVTTDPGTGLDVAKFLAACRPVCPLIIHSTNVDRAYSMHNELRFADWSAGESAPSERIGSKRSGCRRFVNFYPPFRTPGPENCRKTMKNECGERCFRWTGFRLAMVLVTVFSPAHRSLSAVWNTRIHRLHRGLSAMTQRWLFRSFDV